MNIGADMLQDAIRRTLLTAEQAGIRAGYKHKQINVPTPHGVASYFLRFSIDVFLDQQKLHSREKMKWIAIALP